MSQDSKTVPVVTARCEPGAKLFVLDTNVLMHDPTSLFRFEEHDIYLPMATLEELDNNKKGMSEVSRNARQASRFLDEIVTQRRRRHRGRHPAGARTAPSRRPDGCFCRPRRSTASCRRGSRAERPTTRSSAWSSICRNRTSAQVILVSQRHQHAHQGARAGPGRRGLFQRQGAGGHRPPLHRRARAAGGFLGPARQGDGILAAGRATRSTACAGPLCSQLPGERVRLPGERQAVLRDREGVPARPRSCRRSRTTPISATTCGASPRATASRISRSTC